MRESPPAVKSGTRTYTPLLQHLLDRMVDTSRNRGIVSPCSYSFILFESTLVAECHNSTGI